MLLINIKWWCLYVFLGIWFRYVFIFRMGIIIDLNRKKYFNFNKFFIKVLDLFNLLYVSRIVVFICIFDKSLLFLDIYWFMLIVY